LAVQIAGISIKKQSKTSLIKGRFVEHPIWESAAPQSALASVSMKK